MSWRRRVACMGSLLIAVTSACGEPDVGFNSFQGEMGTLLFSSTLCSEPIGWHWGRALAAGTDLPVKIRAVAKDIPASWQVRSSDPQVATTAITQRVGDEIELKVSALVAGEFHLEVLDGDSVVVDYITLAVAKPTSLVCYRGRGSERAEHIPIGQVGVACELSCNAFGGSVGHEKDLAGIFPWSAAHDAQLRFAQVSAETFHVTLVKETAAPVPLVLLGPGGLTHALSAYSPGPSSISDLTPHIAYSPSRAGEPYYVGEAVTVETWQTDDEGASLCGGLPIAYETDAPEVISLQPLAPDSVRVGFQRSGTALLTIWVQGNTTRARSMSFEVKSGPRPERPMP